MIYIILKKVIFQHMIKIENPEKKKYYKAKEIKKKFFHTKC